MGGKHCTHAGSLGLFVRCLPVTGLLLATFATQGCFADPNRLQFEWDRPIGTLGYDAKTKQVIAGGEDGVLLWNISSGETKEIEGSVVYTRALFAAGSVVIAGADGRVLRGNPPAELAKFEYPVQQLVTSERWFAIATNDGRAVVWDAGSGQEHWRYEPRDFRADIVAVGLADDLLIGASSPGFSRGSMIVAWNLRTKRKKYWIGESNQRGGIIRIAGSNKHFAMSAKDRSLVVRSALDGALVHAQRTESEVPALEFFASGRYLAVGGWDSTMRVLDSRQGFREVFRRDYDSAARAIYVSDDCFPLFVGTNSGRIIVEDLREELEGCMAGADGQ